MADLSLWLIPDEEWHRLLSRVIAHLSQKHNTPHFEPHLTLLSGIAIKPEDAANRTAQLAAQLEALEIVVKRLGHRDEFFRALFLEAERTPALMDAYRMACATFDHEPDDAFLPHVSLLYGDLPATMKNEITAQLTAELKLPLSFRASRMELMVASSRIPPSSWHRVASYTLGRQPSERSPRAEDT